MFFFWGIFRWIVGVPKQMLLQHAFLLIYLGSYFGFFGLTFNLIRSRAGMTAAFFAAPFIWVSLEYVRSNLSFLALPWGLLAHSQHQYLSVIQIASLAGTYSISFLILMVNAALASLVLALYESPRLSGKWYPKIPPNLPLPKGGALQSRVSKTLVATAASLIILTLIYGHITASTPITGKAIKLSLVQGNIEQAKKWDPRYASEIIAIYSELTQEALKDKPDLIIWPETATPGSISLNPELYAETENIVRKAATYLLLGSAQHQKFEEKGSMQLKYFNSAYLIHPGPGRTKNQRYDKIRLFPFGEYLPYKEIIPWSSIGVSESGNYLSGKEFTVFKHPTFRFGVTICWENVFPNLFRQFVMGGAECMINITNEARFGKTAAPYQLVSISVFRAIENKVFVIRCANTGVSCFIDPYGRIIDRLKDEKNKDIFVRGVMSGQITPLRSKTTYTRYGDWFVGMAMIISVGFLISSIFKGSLWKLWS
jgi:apolipoprotein N-acyltransferase